MPKEVKLFRSKYWERDHKGYWIPVENALIDAGYTVHQQIEPCDTAFILCGLMENPNAFENKVLFYNSQPYSGMHQYNLLLNVGPIKTLLEYYDESYNLRALSPNEAVDLITKQYDAHKS